MKVLSAPPCTLSPVPSPPRPSRLRSARARHGLIAQSLHVLPASGLRFSDVSMLHWLQADPEAPPAMMPYLGAGPVGRFCCWGFLPACLQCWTRGGLRGEEEGRSDTARGHLRSRLPPDVADVCTQRALRIRVSQGGTVIEFEWLHATLHGMTGGDDGCCGGGDGDDGGGGGGVAVGW